jgi:hypothetical protein
VTALQRIVALKNPAQTCAWSCADFMRAAVEAKNRWLATETEFGVEYRMLGDAVSQIAPDYCLPAEIEKLVRNCPIPTRRNVLAAFAVSFVKWDLCPQTSGHANPYEPLVEIWEHGGSFAAEHNMYVDVFDTEGMPCGGVVIWRQQSEGKSNP